MAAAVTDPGGTRFLLRLTFKDEDDLSWYMERAEGDVGGLHSANLVRGGTFSTVDYDKMTVRQTKAASRQMRIQAIRALIVAESLAHWQALMRYWSPECVRVRVERERGQPGAGDSLAPLTLADRELRLVALYPYTKVAQDAGEALVFAERIRERARRLKATHLHVVKAGEGQVTVLGIADSGEPAADQPAHAPGSFEEHMSRVDLSPYQGLHQHLRLAGAAADYGRVKAHGAWVPRPLAADERRDAAVRAIREAERRKDVRFLSDVRVEAIQSLAVAEDAYVRARRDVKGKDGEEKRKEAADRWVHVNSCTRLNTDTSDLVEALELSSRHRTS